MLKTKTLIISIFILLLCSYSYGNDNWDIYFGGKFGIGFGGSITEVNIDQVDPDRCSVIATSDRSKGVLAYSFAVAINFISPNNFGLEAELGYRISGERILRDVYQHTLRLHHIDLTVIGKYWLFGKLISVGIGTSLSFLVKSTFRGMDVGYNFRKVDLSIITNLGFNFWETKKSIIATAELSVKISFIDPLKGSGNFYNVGIYAVFGLFYLSTPGGVRLPEGVY